MRLAFYAPMKPPDHGTPSGDRTIARSLILALEQAGASVTLASTLRCRDGQGDVEIQRQIMARADAEIPRLTALGHQMGWQAWITYHNYYKAPDLIGPCVSKALKIPYIQIESTRAHKRLQGPWAAFAKAAEAAADTARIIFYFTNRDAVALRRDAPPQQTLINLPPFLTNDVLPFAPSPNGPILAVGMMRTGDKLLSYEIIAETLAALPHHNWQLNIAGDGPARPQVETLMAPLKGNIRFLGALDDETLRDAYRAASVFFWPGVNEAFGMVYLEAQAAGLPILAQDRAGVQDVLPPGDYPHPNEGSAPLATMLNTLLNDPTLRVARGRASHDNVTRRHLLPAAAATLKAGLLSLGVGVVQ